MPGITTPAERIRIPFGFAPRPYQIPVFVAFERGIKRLMLIWHRRAGKDKTCFNLLVSAAVERVGQYFYVFPSYTQGKKALWDAIDKEGFKVRDHCPPAIVASVNNTEMKLTLKNGSIIQIVGADNIDSIVGTNPVGIVLSEYSLMAPRVLDFLRPILTENRGWLIVNFTPRGGNHAQDLYEAVANNPEWHVSKLTVEDTGAVTPEQVEADRASGMSDELIRQEYYVDFEAGNEGSYYGRLLAAARDEGRIGRFPYTTGLPVHTRWDLGVGDSTAIWCWQDVGRERHFVNYYENSGEGLPHYIHWLQSTGYVFGKHYGPHDIAVREFSSGVSRLETAAKLGIRFTVVPQHNVEDGHEAVRQELVRCCFDETRCKDGLAALRAYHKEYDDKHQTWRPKPVHDWASHGADAFRTGSMGHRGPPVKREEKTATPVPWYAR